MTRAEAVAIARASQTVEQKREYGRKGMAAADPVKMAAARLRNSAKWLAAGKGARATMESFKKGPQNHHSKIWAIRSPSGVSYVFKNLPSFISDNADLFDEDDVIDRYGPGKSRAIGGITSIRPTGKGRVKLQWKGWTWMLGKYRDAESRDPLDRRQ